MAIKYLLLLLLLIPCASAYTVPFMVEGLQNPSDTVFYKVVQQETVLLDGTITLDNSSFSLNLEDGYYRVIISFDDPQTEGYDYYGVSDVFVDDAIDSVLIVVREVGSVAVFAPPESLVKIDCKRRYGEQGLFHSDALGVVHADQLPLGECRVRVAFEDALYEERVFVDHGTHTDVNIDVEKKSSIWVYVLIAAFGMAIIVLLFLFKPAKKPLIKPIPTNEKRIEDILQALPVKEQAIVRFLMEYDGEVSQNTIVHGSGIPKTSLVRLLDSLEGKKIIHVETFGKMKKISLTGWFKNG